MPDNVKLLNINYVNGATPILKKVNLEIFPGDIVFIIGRSGHGKSTLLELCAGLLEPTSGSVLWDDTDIKTFSKKELLDKRRSIGFVFQLHALISNHTIFDNIALPLRSRKGYNEKSIRAKVHLLMEELSLFNVDGLFPEALSSRQLKTASIARALIGDPDLLFLDEPISGIDPISASGIMNVLYKYKKQKNVTIVMTHNDNNVWQDFETRNFALESGMLLPWTEAPLNKGLY
jgi:ABC-type methionine transport system ATPase subunit